eukprot:gene14969-21938_t
MGTLRHYAVDGVVVMKHGEVVQSGTHNELLGDPDGEYAALKKEQEG